VLVFVLLIASTLGCSLCGIIGTGGEEEIVLPPGTPARDEEETVATEEAPEEIYEEEEEEEISLSTASEGLKHLDSYRARFEMSLKGESDGETEQWALNMEMAHVREPFAQHIVLEGSAMGIAEQGGFESIQIGDRQYVLANGECFSSEITEEDEAQDLELFNPDDVMGQIEGARRVRPDENVNGILCRHYVFDEKAVDWAELSSAQGEVWIAVEGDYVVKYVMEAEGKDPVSQERGHIEWTYEIYDVNTPITIEPPTRCEAAEAQYPMMPDATDVFAMGDMLTYQSASSFDDVLDFYQERMPEEGWEDTGESFITSETALLEYTRDGQTINVTITETDDGIYVAIFD